MNANTPKSSRKAQIDAANFRASAQENINGLNAYFVIDEIFACIILSDRLVTGDSATSSRWPRVYYESFLRKADTVWEQSGCNRLTFADEALSERVSCFWRSVMILCALILTGASRGVGRPQCCGAGRRLGS